MITYFTDMTFTLFIYQIQQAKPAIARKDTLQPIGPTVSVAVLTFKVILGR